MIHTLRSLLLQQTRPDALELCLAEHEASLLPLAVLALRGEGLTLRIADDIGPYKKYVPARIAHPEAIIVTADDDAYYWPAWLSELLRAWQPSDRVVLCYRAHMVMSAPDGFLLSYGAWKHDIVDAGVTITTFPTGLGGILYPPDVHHPDVLDGARFQTLSRNADDLWFYWMARLAGTRFRKLGERRHMINWKDSQKQGLWQANRAGGNDKVIASLTAAYGNPLLAP